MKKWNSGISDGRYSIGVTSEEAAESAVRPAAQDVDYIYPEERGCLFEEGTAIRKGTPNIDAARRICGLYYLR